MSSPIKGKADIFKDKRLITSSGKEQTVLEFDRWPQKAPEIIIAGKTMPILQTNLRLPLHFADTKLPIEDGGLDSLFDVSDSPLAYIRRIALTNSADRKIRTKNPKFDRILREWGYLRD